MTLREALAEVRELRPGTNYDDAVLTRWIAALDGRIAREFRGETAPVRYDPETDLETELGVPFPLDEIYCAWLMAMIDFHNGEYGHAENDMALFNTLYLAVGDDAARGGHAPERRVRL